ncbi:MAG TPA: alpha/beta fold hydrolase [Pseudonocardiaceae bacterium]|nr:alpha/beta fold hydrolase [Pseudonocardiaceae bacterium]
MAAPIILVPGFWLGAWAWDDVAERLRAQGHDVTALTLPGLESPDVDRSAITLAEHVDKICTALSAAAAPAVLAVHSGASVPGYGASDRLPERIAAMVYVDTTPGSGAIRPDFQGAEWPLPEWTDLDENMDGISEEQLAEMRARAIPEPAAALREAPSLANPARLAVPSTVICTAFPAEQVKAAAREGLPWMDELTKLHDVRYVDLPTSHWPMFSRPRELAEVIGKIASELP